MGIRRCAVPTCPSLGCAPPCPEHRLRLPKSLRDVPVSACVGVPLPDRLVLLDLESFGRLKLFRRHVVSRDLEANRHLPKFRIVLMIRNAISDVKCQTEAVRLFRLRVDMSVDS